MISIFKRLLKPSVSPLVKGLLKSIKNDAWTCEHLGGVYGNIIRKGNTEIYFKSSCRTGEIHVDSRLTDASFTKKEIALLWTAIEEKFPDNDVSFCLQNHANRL